MELKLEQQQTNEKIKSKLYVKGQFFVDRSGYLNIRILKDEIGTLEGIEEVIVRHHANFFMKIFGLPFERIKRQKYVRGNDVETTN